MPKGLTLSAQGPHTACRVDFARLFSHRPRRQQEKQGPIESGTISRVFVYCGSSNGFTDGRLATGSPDDGIEKAQASFTPQGVAEVVRGRGCRGVYSEENFNTTAINEILLLCAIIFFYFTLSQLITNFNVAWGLGGLEFSQRLPCACHKRRLIMGYKLSYTTGSLYAWSSCM